MDSHYGMVMKERERAQGAAPVRYFAYSTILDRAAFEEWRGQHEYEGFDLPAGVVAEAKDVALVYDFPSRWWGGRAAGLADRAGAHVFGLVFEIAAVDWPIVRHKEGAITNMAVERQVRVQLATGEEVEAVAFATRQERQSQDGPVSARFVEALVRGARSAGLPAAWIEEIVAGAK
jgi:gamma-glutamylcyclotransferase